MLIIRYRRTGKRNYAQYKIVVAEKAFSVKGRFVEALGSYNPHSKEAILKEDRINHWIGVGAQCSDSVHNLLVSKGVIKEAKRKVSFKGKPKEERTEEAKPTEEKVTENTEEKEEKPETTEAPKEEKAEEAKPEAETEVKEDVAVEEKAEIKEETKEEVATEEKSKKKTEEKPTEK